MKKSTSKFTLKQICFMAFTAVLGFFAKPMLSPAINIITDFMGIPGGGVTAGISMLFMVYACGITGRWGTAALMGFTQAIIALGTGFSSNVGLLALVTYTFPGLVIDTVICLPPLKTISLKWRMCFAGGCGVLAGAVLTNILYYHLPLIPFFLFNLSGILSGLVAGGLAFKIWHRTPENMKKGLSK